MKNGGQGFKRLNTGCRSLAAFVVGVVAAADDGLFVAIGRKDAKGQGHAVSSEAVIKPIVAPRLIYSKCAVSPFMTQPRQITP